MNGLGCRELSVSIADIRVVEGLDLDLQPGQFWGLLGPNGIGKTTLLRCLAGLDNPFGGRVLLASRPVDELPRKLLARHLGMLQQHTVYVFDSSVMQTVLTGRHPHLGYWERESAEDLTMANEALDAVGLAGFSGR
ncbi:MAG: ABC transporter ATP-binding protein, partial [Gammaproteobacteria bacterium]|nr:ABC transporter ATP-binding protein [Gammaproteobacteria bacterium]